MARKRVTEQDLLAYQARMEELSRKVGAKYEEMDRQKLAKLEPVRDFGLLLLHDTAADDTQLLRFGARMEHAGHAVERADLFGYKPIDRFDRTPEWQRRHTQAQLGYLRLKERARRVIVVGSGRSCALAALIAEQYPVDALITVGGGLRARRSPMLGKSGRGADARIARIARRNLFSIVCPVLTIVPDDCGAYTAQSASMFSTETRSDDVRRLELHGARVDSVWAEREDEIADAVQDFLTDI